MASEVNEPEAPVRVADPDTVADADAMEPLVLCDTVAPVRVAAPETVADADDREPDASCVTIPAEIVKLNVSESTVCAAVSVARTLSDEYVPAVVGVPEITPTLDTVTPAGHDPTAAKVSASESLKLSEIVFDDSAVPTVPV